MTCIRLDFMFEFPYYDFEMDFFWGNGAEVGCDLRKAIWGSWKDALNCKLELNLAWKHYLSAKKNFFIYFYGFNQRTPLVKSKNYCKNASTLYKTPETDLLLDISTSKHRKILHRCLKNRCSSTYPHLLHINQLSECYACKHKFTITTKKKQKLHNFWLNGIFHAENFFINFSTFSIWFLYNFISIWKKISFSVYSRLSISNICCLNENFFLFAIFLSNTVWMMEKIELFIFA